LRHTIIEHLILPENENPQGERLIETPGMFFAAEATLSLCFDCFVWLERKAESDDIKIDSFESIRNEDL